MAKLDQLIQIYISSCISPSSLKEFVVQIPGAESVKVSLDRERWVFDNGQRCLPIYIPFTEQLNIIAIELWSTTSPGPVSVFPLELNDLQIGRSATHSVKWIDKGEIRHCNLIVAKAQIFNPNRFSDALPYNRPESDCAPDLKILISRCALNERILEGKAVSFRANASGYKEAKSRRQTWMRNQICNETLKLDRIKGHSARASSLDLSLVDDDSELIRFFPMPLQSSFPTSGFFSIPNASDSLEATLYLSISPILDTEYESLLLIANPNWEKVEIALHSLQINDDSSDSICFTAFATTNIEEYQRKVHESMMLWPPFPVTKLVKPSDQNATVTVSGEEPSHRFYVSEPVEDSFSTLRLTAAIFDAKEFVFNPDCYVVAELYSCPTKADLSPNLIGYCSMKLSDQDRQVNSDIYGCNGILTWSARRSSESRSASITGDVKLSKNGQSILARKPDIVLRKAHRILHVTHIPALRLVKSSDQESKLRRLLEESQKELHATKDECERLQNQLAKKTSTLTAVTDDMKKCEDRCEQINNEKLILESRLNDYVELQESFLQKRNIDESPLAVAQLKTLLQQSSQENNILKRDNEKKQKVIDSMRKQISKSIKMQKTLVGLKEAHAAQTNYLQSIQNQEDRKKIEKFYRTIQYQEEIIINLEGLIRSCKVGTGGPSTRCENSDAENEWKKRAVTAETRCNALEDELHAAAEHYGKEMASLQTQLMEVHSRPRSADSTFGMSAEDTDNLEREQESIIY